MRAAERIADFKYQKKQAIAVMPSAGDLAARKRSPLKVEDLTPEECEATMEARAKAGPPHAPLLKASATQTDLSGPMSDRRFRRI
jgi:hypothetical protein